MPELSAHSLFQRMVGHVPAYSRYLRAQGCDPTAIKSSADLEHVPSTSKKTYLQQFPIPDLCWGGRLAHPLEYCATSGSTSEPFYFPRDARLAEQYADVIERFLDASSYGVGSTLVIVGFGMGVWIGGVITVRAVEIAGERTDRSISILPTGINKAEILKGLVKLAPLYDQTILIGYPPFVKDVLDEAEAAGVDLATLKLRLMFAAESFTEQFRDYVVAKAGVGNPHLDTLNIYGTAEIGAMAYETPTSILIRRLASGRPQLFESLFQQITKTPTLAQYNPDHVYFEEVDGSVLLTADAALPLMRYAIGDRGGVIAAADMRHRLAAQGIDLDAERAAAGIPAGQPDWPFVYVYERSDFSVSLYGATLFPEIVKDGLVNTETSRSLTERFTMAVRYTNQQQQYLEVNLETRQGVTLDAATRRRLGTHLLAAMTGRSSELREICRHIGSNKVVKFVYWPAEHPRYFKPGVKQRWTEKTPAPKA